jgi:hypothetical protein
MLPMVTIFEEKNNNLQTLYTEWYKINAVKFVSSSHSGPLTLKENSKKGIGTKL